MYSVPMIPVETDVPALRAALLDWYDHARRRLPWRAEPGEAPDAYRVWLSEIMLQQTTVTHATAYFLEFQARWPTVDSLADAPDAAVMGAWAGLGYYARARNLLACARTVTREHGGRFPSEATALRALPGVGDYTAAAIAAIAFDQPANVVDGNVERVISRLFAVKEALPRVKPQLRALANALATRERPGDWAQALMDLGATICRPKSPTCLVCPIAFACAARAEGVPGDYPRSEPKAERPNRQGAVFVLTCEDFVATVERPPRGLLGGMAALPTTAWTTDGHPEAAILAEAPTGGDWKAHGRGAARVHPFRPQA